ncbi:MAG: septal ring lytic transglycosylase RlpA family protein, partial [Pseudomonadota bacterium]
NPCGLTSSGTPFKPNRPDNAASPIYPDGTRLLVWNPATKAAALIRIDNAGPYWGNRKLDVSRATAEKLGFSRQGVAKLKTRVISAPNRSESRYVRNRKYEPVAGFLGKFETLDDAEYALAAVMAVRAMAASSLAPVTAAVVARSHAEPVRAEKQRKRAAKKAATLIARIKQDKAPVPTTQLARAVIAE